MPRAWAPSRTGCSQLEVELAVARFPRRPHRLAHADDVEVGGTHQVEIAVEVEVRLVLGVVGGAEPQRVVVRRCSGHGGSLREGLRWR